ncbi:glycosyltransferase [Eubacteriales bacterium OttesenSCG-928-A19]|nr:glycosyltransferase [Eubacteriales bacterium OttesenSCG-928-A19]
MKVLICTEGYYPNISGVITHIETLKSCLEADGHETMVVCTLAGRLWHELRGGILYSPGIRLKRIYGYGLAQPISHKRMRLVRRFHPDIVHIHTEFSQGLFGQHVAKKLRIPLVYTMHTFYDDYVSYITGPRYEATARKAACRYTRYFADHATEVIVPSPKIANYLLSAGYQGECTLVPNTVMAEQFKPENVDPEKVERLKKRMGIAENDICLCYVGRLGQEKSNDILIEHFAKGFGGEDRYKLFIIGDGPLRQRLEAMVSARRISGQVFLLGAIDHALLPTYYQCFSIFTTASLSEVHSISLIEAQVSGLYAINRLDVPNRHQIMEGITGEHFETAEDFERSVRGYGEKTAGERAENRRMISAIACRYGPEQFAALVKKIYRKAQRQPRVPVYRDVAHK